MQTSSLALVAGSFAMLCACSAPDGSVDAGSLPMDASADAADARALDARLPDARPLEDTGPATMIDAGDDAASSALDAAANDAAATDAAALDAATFDAAMPSDAGLDAPVAIDAAASPDASTSVCSPSELTDAATGYFVDSSFSGVSTGSASQPFQTIAAAITQAVTDGRARVYLAPRTYVEHVTLPTMGTGLSIEGGWNVSSATAWQRDCSAAAADQTVIVSPTPVGVRGTSVTATLLSLTVRTTVAPFPGFDRAGISEIGVLVDGPSSHLTLRRVVIVPSPGGAGGPASSAGGPDGPSSCTTGQPGVCSDGSDGAPVTAPAPTLGDLGTFSSAGYVPLDGADGTAGNPGHNGTPGGPANPCTCVACFRGPGASCESGPVGTLRQGLCGCAGAAGHSGRAGRGGGASIAVLFLDGTSTLSIEGSRLAASSGGRGTDGTAGGPGGAGSAGVRQDGDLFCGIDSATPCVFTSCSFGPCCQATMPTVCTGPAAGGMGGHGSDGSAATSAPGGPSIALVTVGSPTVSLDAASMLQIGAGGAGGAGGSIGRALLRLDL